MNSAKLIVENYPSYGDYTTFKIKYSLPPNHPHWYKDGKRDWSFFHFSDKKSELSYSTYTFSFINDYFKIVFRGYYLEHNKWPEVEPIGEQYAYRIDILSKQRLAYCLTDFL
jgi:hypothetical protein